MGDRYTTLEFVEPTPAEFTAADGSVLKLEVVEEGVRLRVPGKRSDFEQAVAELLIDREKAVLAASEAPVKQMPTRTPSRPSHKGFGEPGARHGVYDNPETMEREVWSQGGLDRRMPADRVQIQSRKGGRVKPWGAYPPPEESRHGDDR